MGFLAGTGSPSGACRHSIDTISTGLRLSKNRVTINNLRPVFASVSPQSNLHAADLAVHRIKLIANEAMNTMTAIDRVIWSIDRSFARRESTCVSPKPNCVLLLNPR